MGDAPAPRVGVIMGSDSDWSVMADAAHALAEFDVPFEVGVVSAHRTPGRMLDYARTAAGRGIEVIIAGAGGAAHLPGMVAAATPLPVIGVPVPLAKLDGLDSLLSIVQMPAGVPVATVSIGGARNAGLLAVRILGSSDTALRARVEAFQADLEAAVLAKDEALRDRLLGDPAKQVKLPASSKESMMAGWAGNPTFDVFKLPEEHDELRAAIRALAEKEIAPYAAEVDEKPRFPDEALAALNASGFSAIHVPEEYDGQGADSVATCIVIEEVARVCASSSLIPAVNKLGTMGLILRGSDELKKQVLPTLATGEAMASYALSEREAGSDAAAMRTRAKADGDDWILNGAKCWITNGGKSTWYTVMAVTDPDKGANGISAFMVHKDDEGFSGRAQGAQARHQGFADHRVVLRELPHPG